ncbi:efflux RND transporter periplasmic adaptor subunit, partial [Pseudoduganella sp. RAF53_2]
MKNNHVKYITAAIIGVGAITLGSRGMQVLHAKESASEPVPPLVHKGEQLLVPEKSPLRKALDVVPVAGADVSTSFLLPAVVEADPARLVKVLPPLSGRIVSLNKHLGDEVKVGDVLFTIDSADLAQASADAGKAQAALSLARRNLDRQSELDRSDIAAKRDLDQARSDYEAASSEAARAQARLSQLGAGKGAGSGHALAVRSP